MGKDKENHPTFVVFPARHIPSSLDYKQVEIMAVLILDSFFEKYVLFYRFYELCLEWTILKNKLISYSVMIIGD